jgi:hypothetical protein
MTMSGPDPRPIGWFALARSSELAPGCALRGVLAMRPYRLGRRADGTLDSGGSLRELVEQNGFVFAWHHPRDSAPTFRLPVLDEAPYRPFRHRELYARTHPQEVYENSIDAAHLPVVHGYRDIRVLEPMRVDGPEMHVRYEIARGLQTARFEVHLHGLGVAHNHIEVPRFGIRVRMLALATPTTLGRCEIRLAVAVARSWALPLPELLLPFVELGVQRTIVRDFRQDIAVWEGKRFLTTPLLVKSDGPIPAFRRFCAQFYAAALDEVA